jgi:hypothetical protein
MIETHNPYCIPYNKNYTREETDFQKFIREPKILSCLKIIKMIQNLRKQTQMSFSNSPIPNKNSQSFPHISAKSSGNVNSNNQNQNRNFLKKFPQI